jgi:hypothetical protein
MTTTQVHVMVDSTVTDRMIDVDSYSVVRFNCPDWFKREDFRAWLNADQTATWHIRGEEPGDFSDAFTNYDAGEGWDMYMGLTLENAPTLPQDIWLEICRICDEQGVKAAVIWMTNLEEA